VYGADLLYSHRPGTCSAEGQLVMKGYEMPKLFFSSPIPDRRNQRSRDALLTRVVAEFQEMPCLRLTGRQAQRLFDLRPDVCQRLLGALLRDGTLTYDHEQRYRLNESKSSRDLVGSAQAYHPKAS